MAYSQFTIEKVKSDLGVTIAETFGTFSQIPAVQPSVFLSELLEKFVPLALAIDTEKARSELIVAPVLVELREQLGDRISLFSGRDFNVDSERGLVGRCDFLVSHSAEQLFIEAPIVVLVEAKNDNISSGLGQCIAAMVAAQLFNHRQGTLIKTIYGVVTTGTNWKFLKLSHSEIKLDLKEYSLNDIGQLLGILRACIEPFPPHPHPLP